MLLFEILVPHLNLVTGIKSGELSKRNELEKLWLKDAEQTT